jgi:membrane protease YdiL (CAAX protease family)
MHPETRAAPVRNLDPFAVTCWVVWSLGALASVRVGVWMGVGGAAILLGSTALALHHRFLLKLLRPAAREIAIGLVAGVVMVAATYLLYPAAQMLPLGIAGLTEQLYGRFREPSFLPILVLLPICILAEELVWRGIVQEALVRRMGPAPAALWCALAYGAAHAGVGSALLVFIAGACGLYWGLLRAASGSLAAPLIAHMLWDVLIFSAAPLVPAPAP